VGPSLESQGFLTGEGSVGIVPLNPSIEGIENTSLNSLTFGVDVTGLTQASNTYQWTDNFTRILGKQTLKFGGSLHFDQVSINPDTAANGSFAFRGTETGLDFADFLLSVASSYSQADSKSFYPRNKYIGAFAQDSWRGTPNLTLNYGVRWDVLPAWRGKYNRAYFPTRRRELYIPAIREFLRRWRQPNIRISRRGWALRMPRSLRMDYWEKSLAAIVRLALWRVMEFFTPPSRGFPRES
jgi:hypothetical protein